MNYKNKLKFRMCLYIVMVIGGVAMLIAGSVGFVEYKRLVPYGGMFLALGSAYIIRAIWLMKNKDKLSEREVKETDERTVMIFHKSNSLASRIYSGVALVVAIVLMVMNHDKTASIILFMLCGLVVIQYICQFIMQRKY